MSDPNRPVTEITWYVRFRGDLAEALLSIKDEGGMSQTDIVSTLCRVALGLPLPPVEQVMTHRELAQALVNRQAKLYPDMGEGDE